MRSNGGPSKNQKKRIAQLERENARLRALLDLRPRIQVKTLSAEILYDAPDPYSRKVIIDRGLAQGIGQLPPAAAQVREQLREVLPVGVGFVQAEAEDVLGPGDDGGHFSVRKVDADEAFAPLWYVQIAFGWLFLGGEALERTAIASARAPTIG